MKRILLIDTNEMDGNQISLLLNAHVGDLSTQHLRSQKEVEEFLSHPANGRLSPLNLPALIILDVDFPESSKGLSILEKIQSTRSFKDVPVFIFTNNTDKSIVANCYVRGANGYFLKPTPTHSFQKSVQMLAERWQNIIQRGFGYNYKAV